MATFIMSDLMDEDQYWDIVQQSKNNAVDQKSQVDNLVALLTKLSADEIWKFRLRTEQLLHQAHTSNLWCAVTIMNRGFVSDDSFIYFKTWLISCGKDVYNAAVADPDSLINQIDSSIQYYEFESFRYGTHYAIEKVTGKQIVEFQFPKNFPYSEGQYPEVSFSWCTDNPADMKTVCPKLYNKMNPAKDTLSPPSKSRKPRR
ncbi:DUF4240 domain-containing protein [Pseudoflavitalea sp. X16]|uniref:DUF4240 domain-containing protein n=1 Tax=Paraflavitalea devenefica TaxID=2716334 RepID=UPI00141ED425|nr:DUF4240 domain-containing protein [Paraflavitalea devenefica]NII26210.1 DUF4240 domain-containing protein [Paraflavitalea devenefica]